MLTLVCCSLKLASRNPQSCCKSPGTMHSIVKLTSEAVFSPGPGVRRVAAEPSFVAHLPDSGSGSHGSTTPCPDRLQPANRTITCTAN